MEMESPGINIVRVAMMVTSIAMMMTIMTMITMMNGWKQARCVCRTEQSSSVSALSQL